MIDLKIERPCTYTTIMQREGEIGDKGRGGGEGKLTCAR